MTTTEIKRMLKGYIEAETERGRIKDVIDEINTKLYNITSDFTKPRVQSSLDKDILTSLTNRLIELKQKYKEKDIEAAEQMIIALKLINLVESSTLRKILTYRYILDMGWEEIACKEHYSFRHAIRLHGDALFDIKRAIEKEKEKEKGEKTDG